MHDWSGFIRSEAMPLPSARRPFLLTFILCTLLWNDAVNAAPAAPPHIICILTDDMGLGDLGCYGGKLVPTPNIDRLAAGGTRFTQYYSAAPICSPSRAGLITGLFPARVKLTSFLQTRAGNRGCEQADFLDPAFPSLPRALKAAGYATAHFGKWHLGGGRDVDDAPKFTAYGYDEHAGTWESPEPHPDITATDWIWSDKDKVKRWDRTAFFIDKTLDFLERKKATQPCFVNVWLDDPHTPWVPAAGTPKGDTPANLGPVLADIDQQMGRLMDGLESRGLTNNTLIIFVSDNGPLPTFDRTRSAGLRGSKLSLYESGIRLPFIIRWPDHTPAGRVDQETVLSAVDLLPTLCAITGAASPAKLDGQDMSAAFTGKAVTRQQPLLWEYGRNAKWFKYPPNAEDRSPNLAIREGPWKLLINADGASPELYDLATDPTESKNLAEANPDITKRLADQVLAWRKDLP
jgi:arylsulfatase A-like enzyme